MSQCLIHRFLMLKVPLSTFIQGWNPYLHIPQQENGLRAVSGTRGSCIEGDHDFADIDIFWHVCLKISVNIYACIENVLLHVYIYIYIYVHIILQVSNDKTSTPMCFSHVTSQTLPQYFSVLPSPGSPIVSAQGNPCLSKSSDYE